jgi:hypothetical protein
MTRTGNCLVSAALERAVNAPEGMFVTIGTHGIWWVVTDELDPADATRLDLALNAALDAGYTSITRDGLSGRIDGIPIRLAHAGVNAVTGRHLSAVK